MSIALNKLKRAVSLFTAGMVALSTFAFAGNTALAVQFYNDVTPSMWSYEVIQQGQIDGYFDPGANFRPFDRMNRAEVAKVIYVIGDFAAGGDLPATPTFKDVNAKDWFYGPVEKLAAAGVLLGDTDAQGKPTGYFHPEREVNRAEAVKIIDLALKVPTDLEPVNQFSDVPTSPKAWFTDFVTTAYNQSVVDGYKTPDGKLTGKFGPADYLTREQFAKLAVTGQDPKPRECAASDPNCKNPVPCDANEPGCVDPCIENPDLASCQPPTNFKGNLEVSLNAIDGDTLPLLATNVVLASYKFTAVGGDVNVKGLTLHRSGVGEATDFTNVYIFQDGVRGSTGRTFKENEDTVTFSSLKDLVIKENKSSMITVVAEVAGPGVAGTGNKHVVSLDVMADIVLNGDGTVKGDFPLEGPEFTIGGQTTLVNTVTVSAGSTLADVNLGSKHAELATAKLEAGSGHDLDLVSIDFTQGGSIDNEDLGNLTLETSDDEVLATVKEVTGETVTFQLDKPLLIQDGKTENLSIYGDLLGGKTTDDVAFYIEETLDVNATDTVFEYGANVVNQLSLDDANFVDLVGGDITVVDNGPEANDISNDSDDNVLFDYSITSVLEGIEVRKTQVAFTIKDENGDIPSFTAANTATLNGATVLGGACASDEYEITTANNSDADDMALADMIQSGSLFARVTANDGDGTDGGICLYSSQDLTTLANAAVLTEVNPYHYIEDARIVDASNDDAVVVDGLTTVDTGVLCTADDTPLAVCDVANTYAKEFDQDYDLAEGTTDYSIRADIGAEMVPGYLVGAQIQFPAHSMKDTNANQDVDEDAVVGAGGNSLPGNFMTITADDLSVSAAAIPTSQTYVKGSKGVGLLGVSLQAGTAGAITVNDMTVRLYASDVAFADNEGNTAAKDIVQNVSLYDGNVLVDGPTSLKLVDAGNDGFTAGTDYYIAEFNSIDTDVAAGSTKTLTVKADLLPKDGSFFLAADVLPSADIDAEDKDGDTVTATGTQLNGSLPKLPVITIGNAGSLIATSENNPNPGIVIAGSQMQFMGQYRFSAVNDAFDVKTLSIMNDATGVFDTPVVTTAISGVVIKYPNAQGVEQTSAPIQLNNGKANFTGLTFRVPQGQDATLKIYANVSTKGQVGESISGKIVRLGLQESDNNNTTFRAVGVGSQAVDNFTGAPSASVKNASNIADQVVRTNKPTFDTVAVQNNAIVDQEQELYAFTVKADAVGSVQFARFVFSVSNNGALQDLSNFRFARNGSNIDQANIRAVAAGTDLKVSSLTDSADDIVVVSFDEPETVSNPGALVTYTLRATTSGSVDNDTVSTQLLTNEENNEVTNITAGASCGGVDPLCSTGNGNTARVFDTGIAAGKSDNEGTDAGTTASFDTLVDTNILVGDTVRLIVDAATDYPVYCTVTAALANTTTDDAIQTDCTSAPLVAASAITVAGEGLYSTANDFALAGGTARNVIWSDNSADAHGFPTVADGTVTIGTGTYDFTNGARLDLQNDTNAITLEK